MRNKDNPQWCDSTAAMPCKGDNDREACERLPCRAYNPKMTGPEALEKAEWDDKIWNGIGIEGYGCIKKQKDGALLYYVDSSGVPMGTFMERTWTIIPQKKTVTVDIPENAENYREYYKSGGSCCHESKVLKITYETPSEKEE